MLFPSSPHIKSHGLMALPEYTYSWKLKVKCSQCKMWETGRHHQAVLAHYWRNGTLAGDTTAISTQLQTDSSQFLHQLGIIALEISYASVTVPLNLALLKFKKPGIQIEPCHIGILCNNTFNHSFNTHSEQVFRPPPAILQQNKIVGRVKK